jgi:hypothetical protein
MIQTRLQVLLIIASVSLIIVIWQLIIRGKLRPAYAILWLFSSVLFFFLVLARGSVHLIANYFQVEYTPSFVFAMGLLFTIILLLSQSVVISSMSKKIIELAEHYALMQWKQEQLVAQSKRFERFAILMLNKHMKENWQLESPTLQEEDDESILLQLMSNAFTNSHKEIMPFLPENIIIENQSNCSDENEEDNNKVLPFIREFHLIEEETNSPVGDQYS